MTGQDFRNKIEFIRLNLVNGIISYDEAKELAQPVIDEMNKKGMEIAKKHNQKFKAFTFSALMR